MKDSFGRFNKMGTEVENKAEDDLYSTFKLQAEFQDSPQKLLTKRQLECLILTAFGFKNIEIANILIVSESTIKKTLDQIFKRLKTNNRTSAATLGFVYGILTTEILNEIFVRFELKDKLPIVEEKWWLEE